MGNKKTSTKENAEIGKSVQGKPFTHYSILYFAITKPIQNHTYVGKFGLHFRKIIAPQRNTSVSVFPFQTFTAFIVWSKIFCGHLRGCDLLLPSISKYKNLYIKTCQTGLLPTVKPSWQIHLTGFAKALLYNRNFSRIPLPSFVVVEQ